MRELEHGQRGLSVAPQVLERAEVAERGYPTPDSGLRSIYFPEKAKEAGIEDTRQAEAEKGSSSLLRVTSAVSARGKDGCQRARRAG